MCPNQSAPCAPRHTFNFLKSGSWIYLAVADEAFGRQVRARSPERAKRARTEARSWRFHEPEGCATAGNGQHSQHNSSAGLAPRSRHTRPAAAAGAACPDRTRRPRPCRSTAAPAPRRRCARRCPMPTLSAQRRCGSATTRRARSARRRAASAARLGPGSRSRWCGGGGLYWAGAWSGRREERLRLCGHGAGTCGSLTRSCVWGMAGARAPWRVGKQRQSPQPTRPHPAFLRAPQAYLNAHPESINRVAAVQRKVDETMAVMVENIDKVRSGVQGRGRRDGPGATSRWRSGSRASWCRGIW